jgi:curli biogenesis system outer membrane secretion channel CsgG
MKKAVFSALLFLAFSLTLFSQEFVIAVSDFKVESRNPSYEFLGKGISRLVAGELRKSGGVRLVEREDMNRLLAEQELSLSDLMNEKNQVRIGKMLSAKFLVMGDLIDMGNGGVLVSLRMVRVETGEVVWQDETQEKLSVYDYMGAYFAKSLLGSLGVNAGQLTLAKMEKKEEKKPEAIIKVSQGIDAFDRKDTVTAQATLEQASAIDPANEVASEYLAKLVTNTTKFKVMLEPYYSDQNPAYLGVIRTDRLYVSINGAVQAFMSAIRNPPPAPMLLPNGNELLEWAGTAKCAYSFPVADNFGFSIEVIDFATNNDLQVPSSTINAHSMQTGAGGIAGGGYKLNSLVSIGLGLGVYAESNSNVMFFTNYADTLHLAFSFNGGILFRNPDESAVFDMQAGYCTGKIGLIDPDTVTVTRDVAMPLFIESTYTMTFNQKHTFIILKQLNDICFDRIYYYGRVIPAVEHFFQNWLSLRLGAELAYARLNTTDNFGYGAAGGLTFRIIDLGMDIDLNASYRLRPSRVVEGIMYPEGVVTLSISWNDAFISRGK